MASDRLPAPASPPGPGALLRNWIIDEKDITQERLADAMGVSRLTVSQIVNGRRNVTAEMALRLAKVTSTTAKVWLDLQRELDLHVAREKLAGTIDGLRILREPRSEAELFDDE
jgi:addiction module HigA family antidote